MRKRDLQESRVQGPLERNAALYWQVGVTLLVNSCPKNFFGEQALQNSGGQG